ncbi:helix-turn-helix transcriptional regulator [Bacillaceae bacterium Marseille-Q3522]|nr:helix-turn-helix transcriptional regulator [Bacillaceae bacterium Marseille-Q3522]
MLSINSYGTYFFKFKSGIQEQIAGIHTLGWEKRESPSYYWDGLKRWEKGKIIFQYTLHGEGEIVLEEEVIRLKPGDAFFVNIPSNHRYYLPKDSERWEFVHFTLFGERALRIFEEITKYNGNIFRLDKNSAPIQLIFNLHSKTVLHEISDEYKASAAAYTFLMELYRYILNIRDNGQQKLPESITRAVHFIQHNYAKPIALEDIVEAAGISKYYFSRLFHKTMHVSPLSYVTKIRIEKAIELLNNSHLTIEEISQKVGYSNGNYFNKVFRSIIGISPGRYRNSKTFGPFDEIIHNS